jgi:hypothetical protein
MIAIYAIYQDLLTLRATNILPVPQEDSYISEHGQMKEWMRLKGIFRIATSE